MIKGSRVEIIRPNFGHPDLVYLTGTEGIITAIDEPAKDDDRLRYTVTFFDAQGPREHLDHFPLYEADLRLIELPYHRWPRSWGGWQGGSIIRCEGDGCQFCETRWNLVDPYTLEDLKETERSQPDQSET